MTRKRHPVHQHLVLKPEFCPEAVLEWSKTPGKTGNPDVTERAKRHLCALGWKLWRTTKSNNKLELRYESPSGKVFYSLRTACNAVIDQGGLSHIPDEPNPNPNPAPIVCESNVVLLEGPSCRPKRKLGGDDDDWCEPIRNVKPRRGKVPATLRRLRAEMEKELDARRLCDCDNYDECLVCCYGGDLVLCDGCPNAFHTSCLGGVDVGDWEWFCPSCCCEICSFEIKKQDPCHEDGAVSCEQCMRKYHTSCLELSGESRVMDGKVFCTCKCERVFLGINKLLGKSSVVGPDGDLNWTLLSPSTELDEEIMTKNYRQHKLALDVMHECFETSTVPHTKSDTIDGVIFNKQSKFRGFYTVVLEKNEEVISAATVRVYGEVVEVPLVATKWDHRRQGMCRILMNELEQQLMNSGVERVVLPSAESALGAWKALGYSKMAEDERLKFLNHSFLNFQDVTTCHKLLKKQTCGATETKKQRSKYP